MRSLPISLAIPTLFFSLSGCAPYTPQVKAGHTPEQYNTDLEVCRTSSAHAVYLKNAAYPWTWIISPVTGPPATRAAIRKCLETKGYALTKGGD